MHSQKNSSPHCISSSQPAFCRYSVEWADWMQGRLRCSNEADPGDFLFTQLDTPESGAFRQWTPVISSWIKWNTSWFHWPRTSHKLQFSQLPNQHGTTWAVTSTAQWADCFWECNKWPTQTVTRCKKCSVKIYSNFVLQMWLYNGPIWKI